jgi:uncharacterized Zn finger protein
MEVLCMAKEKLPKLTESHVRELAGERSFERGKSYYRQGAILEPVRLGMELRADCAGSEDEPYQLSVALTEDSIGEASCTCPYDWGGLCKHLVALLLAYVHTPEAFRVIPPMKQVLAERSKEELITIIDEMIKREPELISVVELSAATRSAKSVDVETYRRQVQRALRQSRPHAIEKELRALRDAAARLAKAGDWLDAGAVYHVLLVETVDHYDEELQMMDEDGDIAVIVDELAQGLSQCLKESSANSATRRAWLEALLEAKLADIELGGIDLAPSARDAVLEHATDEEWKWIEEHVRAEIAKSHDWAREVLVRFLAEGQERHGQENAAAALIREMGTPQQRAFLLVDEGKTDEAVALARKHFTQLPGLMEQFADALVEAGAKDDALALMTEQAEKKDAYWNYIEWLVKHHRKHGDPQEALKWQQKVFTQHPSVEAFKVLREVSSKLSRWEQVRADVLGVLEREKRMDALIEIALHEGDVARALELLPRVSGWGWRDYKSEVAQAAEKDHPEAALSLYKEVVEQAIGRRGRDSYQEAAEYLKRVKKLYKRLNAQSDWDGYIQGLRTQYARLPALQEELRRAQL